MSLTGRKDNQSLLGSTSEALHHSGPMESTPIGMAAVAAKLLAALAPLKPSDKLIDEAALDDVELL